MGQGGMEICLLWWPPFIVPEQRTQHNPVCKTQARMRSAAFSVACACGFLGLDWVPGMENAVSAWKSQTSSRYKVLFQSLIRFSSRVFICLVIEWIAGSWDMEIYIYKISQAHYPGLPFPPLTQLQQLGSTGGVKAGSLVQILLKTCEL